MQQFSTNYQNALAADPRILCDLYELYEPAYVPPVGGGFDPNDAIEKFSSESITWDGLAYRREVVSRGDIVRSMGQEQNSVTIEFSNVSRYMATLAQSQVLEGCFLVIRTIAMLSGSFVTDDSAVLFTGRLEKPSTIDKGRFSISARQDFGAINQEVPFSKFVPDDPNGVLPSSPLFEGFRTFAIGGAFTYLTEVLSTSFIGALLGKKKKKTITEQWSSVDLTPFGKVVTEVFGSCQIEATPIIFADTGFWLNGLWVWCKGPIGSIDNFEVKTESFYGLFDVQHHLGTLGGTGAAIVRGLVPQTGGNVTEDFRFPGSGLFSLTAFTGASFLQGVANGPEVISTPPTMVALIRGRSIDLPDSSGDYTDEGWTDNPVHQARYILTNSRFVNVNPGFMEDSINYLTSLHCDGPVIDDSDDQIIVVSDPDLTSAGESYYRYRSTGLYTPRYFLYNHLGDVSIVPEVEDGPYIGFDPGDLPTDPGECPDGYHRDPVSGACVADGSGITAAQPILRKRYTANFPITDSVRAVDLLYKTVFLAFKGYMRVNKNGKFEIRSEMPSDSTRVRVASAVGDTALKINDILPWKTGPDLLNGRLLIGLTLTTSEVRDVSTATYSADGNAITLVASETGSNTFTASGATLTGGSTTVRASGTLTVAGTPAPGNVLTATINGVAISYVLTSQDTNSTAAAMLTAYINATRRLSGFIEAVWDSATPTVITLSAKYGVLNLSSAMLKTHGVGVVDPLVAPTIAGAASGALAAGLYKVAYSDVTTYGQTAPTPASSVTLTANQKINVSGLPAFPAGVTSRNFFVSESPNSKTLRYVVNRTDAADFSINALPLPEAARRPRENTTAEEIIRVAMSLATNSQDILPAWAPLILVVLNDIYLPDVLNGHKYKATSITTGITAATVPVWPTAAGGTVVDGGVTWTEFGETVLGQAGLTRANVLKDTFNWPLGSEQSSINQIKMSFRDRKNDFALTPMLVNDRAHQTQVSKFFPYEVDGSAIDGFNQANRIANWLLSKYRDGDWFNTMGTRDLRYALALEEGDVICSSDDSGGLINVATRVEQLSISPRWEISIGRARLYSTNMYSDDAEKHTIPMPTVLRYVGLADSVVEFIDNFAIRESDTLVPGFYVAVSRDLTIPGEWRGWILYADYGDGYAEIARGDIAAIVGECTTTLDTVTDTTVLDTVSDVTFTLKYGPPFPAPNAFLDATEAEMLANPYRNLFLVGDEYLQAGTIVDNGDQSFTITDFLRGRFETNTAEYLVHGATERIVFLNGAEKFVQIDASRVGTAYNYKAVTTNQDVADATPVSFTWMGNNVKPRRHTDAVVTKDASGDLLIRSVDHPRPHEIPAESECQIWVDADRDNPGTDLKLTLPMVTGTTQAALMAASVGIVDEDGNLITTSWAFKNNVFSLSGVGAGVTGTTIQAIEATFQRFDFELACGTEHITEIGGSVPQVGFGNGFGAALHERADAAGPYPIPSAADCPITVEWSVPTDYWDTYPDGSVRETYTSYGAILLVVDGVDPGFNPCTVTSGEIVNTAGDDARSGPRYTFLVNGNEIAAYKNFKPAGGNKAIVKVAMGDTIPFPLRLSSWCNSTDLFLRNVMYGGSLGPSTIFSLRDQVKVFGSVQTAYYLRLFQKSRYAGIEGVPLDLVVP